MAAKQAKVATTAKPKGTKTRRDVSAKPTDLRSLQLASGTPPTEVAGLARAVQDE